MPAWLVSAFALIRSFGARAVARVPARARQLAIPAAGAGAGAFIGTELAEDGVDPVTGLPLVRRRRRRKALTHDDLRLALTIASAISKKAAENFILTRVRSG